MNTQYMSTNKLIIFGTLDLAELAHYYLSKDSNYEIVGFTVNKEYLDNEFFTPRGSKIKYPVFGKYSPKIYFTKDYANDILGYFDLNYCEVI